MSHPVGWSATSTAPARSAEPSEKARCFMGMAGERGTWAGPGDVVPEKKHNVLGGSSDIYGQEGGLGLRGHPVVNPYREKGEEVSPCRIRTTPPSGARCAWARRCPNG